MPSSASFAACQVAPSRERGSKHARRELREQITSRSLTGAWIETQAATSSRSRLAGRSLTGAWIETSAAAARARARTRSLPHGSVDRNERQWQSTGPRHWSLPHGSVDRNSSSPLFALWGGVAPSRERGSKLLYREGSTQVTAVAPSRERGSKQGSVAAWRLHQIVAPSRERGSKRAVDRGGAMMSRSLPHGSVDRNLINPMTLAAGASRSLTGAWIETISWRMQSRSSAVAPSRERGSKLQRCAAGGGGCKSLPHGSVDRNSDSAARLKKHRCRSLTGAWIET